MSDTFGEDAGASPPEWANMEQVAHTLAYDGIIARDYLQGKPLPPKRWASITAPALSIVGGNSEPFFHTGADALVKDMPDARTYTLEGQDHAVAPAALAPVLVEFFLG